MAKSNIEVLEWPAKSPDLNIVEKIWEQLSNDIYDGPQFKKIANLKDKINETIFRFNSTKKKSYWNYTTLLDPGYVLYYLKRKFM